MRTRRFIRSLPILIVTLLATSEARAQAVPVNGRTLTVQLNSGETLRGELIEAMGGNLTLAEETGMRAIDLNDISRIRAQRHSFEGKKVAVWVVGGALVTGLGMTMACAQVEDVSCGGVFPVMAISWAVVGGLFGASIASSAWTDVPVTADLRRFARFPQGKPSNADVSGGAARIPLAR